MHVYGRAVWTAPVGHGNASANNGETDAVL